MEKFCKHCLELKEEIDLAGLKDSKLYLYKSQDDDSFFLAPNKGKITDVILGPCKILKRRFVLLPLLENIEFPKKIYTFIDGDKIFLLKIKI